jgi:hypothetical protein
MEKRIEKRQERNQFEQKYYVSQNKEYPEKDEIVPLIKESIKTFIDNKSLTIFKNIENNKKIIKLFWISSQY